MNITEPEILVLGGSDISVAVSTHSLQSSIPESFAEV
jgi:hypothetical protein